MSESVVERATLADRTRVVDTVAAAFADDPAYRYFFDERFLREQAEVYAGYLFDLRVVQGCVWVIDGGLAVSLWDSPAISTTTPPPPDLPAEVLSRIAAFDGVVHPLFPSTPHWYLGTVATHPSYAGRGWGRMTIAAGLSEAEKAGLPAYLETTNAGNVEMYRRSGWSLASETKAPIPVWIMRRGGEDAGRLLGGGALEHS